MKAAIIHELGAAPILGDFEDPVTKDGERIGRLLAASLNPLDLVIAAGKMPHRTVTPPFVASFEGVVDLGSGQTVYLAGPPQPYGSLAELVPAPDKLAIPVPAGLDPVLGNPLKP
jgi:NADPH2:quinone reductase